MNTVKKKLVSWLFETNALRVCPEDKPFWYTSGTIGPYYINTEFLYGGQAKAGELLDVIDKEKSNRLACPLTIASMLRKNYAENEVYRELIDYMTGFVKENISVDEIDLISGGERRDWFFSLIVAEKLGKPHITIYKDLAAVMSQGELTRIMSGREIEGKRVLHIADLITEGSSYERAWIPAVHNRGGEIKWSVVVVDRKQGGGEMLLANRIKAFSMIEVDKYLFEEALKMNLINEGQFAMIMDYIDNPKETMRKFLLEHPEFLDDALKSDQKTKERAELCLEKNLYDLDPAR